LDRAVEKVVVDEDLQLDLAEQVRLVLVPAIHFRAAALPGVSLGVADRHPRDADFVERLAERIELGGLNDGHDQLHATKFLVVLLFSAEPLHSDRSYRQMHKDFGHDARERLSKPHCARSDNALVFRASTSSTLRRAPCGPRPPCLPGARGCTNRASTRRW